MDSEFFHIHVMEPLPSMDPGDDQRLQLTTKLSYAAQALQHAHDTLDDDDKVEKSLLQLLKQIRHVHAITHNADLRFNGKGAETGFDILIALCSSHKSDGRFRRIVTPIAEGITKFALVSLFVKPATLPLLTYQLIGRRVVGRQS